MVTACPVIPARNGPCRRGIHVTWCLFQGWDCIPAVGWGSQLVQLPHLQVRKPETQRLQYSDSLVVQWLRFHASTAGVRIQSLVRELRFQCQAVQPKKKKLQYKPPWYRARAQMQIFYRRDAYNLIPGWSTELFLYTQLGIYSFIPIHTHTHTHTTGTLGLCTLYK